MVNNEVWFTGSCGFLFPPFFIHSSPLIRKLSSCNRLWNLWHQFDINLISFVVKPYQIELECNGSLRYLFNTKDLKEPKPAGLSLSSCIWNKWEQPKIKFCLWVWLHCVLNWSIFVKTYISLESHSITGFVEKKVKTLTAYIENFAAVNYSVQGKMHFRHYYSLPLPCNSILANVKQDNLVRYPLTKWHKIAACNHCQIDKNGKRHTQKQL